MSGEEKKVGGVWALIVKRRTAVALAAVFATLLLCYFALCAGAGAGGRLLPRTTLAGVDVGGMTPEEAQEVLQEEITARLEHLQVEFLCNGTFYEVPGREFIFDARGQAEALAETQGKIPFLLRGANLIGALVGGERYRGEATLPRSAPTLEAAAAAVRDPDLATVWRVEGENLILTKGRAGHRMDDQSLRADLEERMALLLNGGEAPSLSVVAKIQRGSPPAEPDLEALCREIYISPADAHVDPESKQIVPAVVGRAADAAVVRAALAAAGEGEERSIPLTLTQPEVTTEALTALLYRDVLGEASTHVGGSASRVGNVRLAGSYLNDTVLLPGEVFSYLATCGPYDTARGYGMGAAYQGGKTVISPGGGVCQGASTLYLAALRANLEIVERRPHGYEPSYIPAGLDATVAGSEIDFKFRNDTDYPVKLQAWLDSKSELHVVIHGTDTTGIHGEPYSANRAVTKYAGTVYEPDESVPQGTTRKDGSRTAYNAVRVDAYNKLVDKNGNVVETVHLHQDNYNARDGVILYNPADAESLGLKTSAQAPVAYEEYE